MGAGALIAALLASLGVSSGPAAPTAPREPPSHRVVLPNGLTVVLVEIHGAPLVGLELRYDVGSKDDPATRPGLAVLLPWLVTRATQHLAEGEADRRLEAAGAFDARSFVGLDSTRFMVTIPSDELALPLWLWSDQMAFSASRVDDALIAQALPLLHSERAVKVESVLEGNVFSAIEDEIFPASHPYRGSGVRGDRGLQGVSADEARAFLKAHYAPEHAILVVTGDFERQGALNLVLRYFGDIPGRGPREPQTAPATPLSGETRLQFAADVDTASVTLAWPTIRSWGAGDADLDVIAHLLTGGRAGWLRWKLVDQMGIASSVVSHQNSRAMGSIFAIRAVATPGHSPQELISAIDEVLLRLESKPPDPPSLRSAGNELLLELLFSFESLGRLSNAYADCEAQGVRQSCLTWQTSRYATVSTTSVTTVAARELPLHRRVVVEVRPTPGAPRSGELRARGPGQAP